MKRSLIRYKLKPDRVPENEQFVKEVFRQLQETKPEGLRYATYKLADEVSFVHIVQYATEEARQQLVGLPAFKNFQMGIRDRCEEQPVVQEVIEIGSYRPAEIRVHDL